MRLAKLAFDSWNEVETAGGRELAVRTGGLDLPGSHTDVRYAKTCLYTLTPDRDFIIGPSPESSRIFMAVGAGTPSSSLR